MGIAGTSRQFPKCRLHIKKGYVYVYNTNSFINIRLRILRTSHVPYMQAFKASRSNGLSCGGREKISSSKQGTGLGLCICKNLAELLGGEVLACSTLGVGSEFVLILPTGVK